MGAVVLSATAGVVLLAPILLDRPIVALLGVLLVLWLTHAAAFNWPILGTLLALGWGAAVFTAEAGFSTGLQSGAVQALSPAKVAPLAVVAAVVAYLCLARRPHRASPPAVAVGNAYLAWLAVAAVFSPDPLTGMARVGQATIPFIAAVVVGGRLRRPDVLLWATVLALTSHVFYGVFIDRDYVGLGVEQRLTGLLIANSFGLAAGTTLLVGYCVWLSRAGTPAIRTAAIAAGAVAAYAMYAAASRTAAFAVLVGAVLAFRASRPVDQRPGRRLVSMALALGLLIFALTSSSTSSVLDRFRAGNTSLGNLTGRLPLWERLVTGVLDRPVFGFGPGAYRSGSGEIRQLLGAQELVNLGQAHNSLIEAFVAGGFMAAALWLWLIVQLLRGAWQAESSPITVVAVAVSLPVYAFTIGNVAGFGMAWYLLCGIIAASYRDASYGAEADALRNPATVSEAPSAAPQGVRVAE